MDRKLIFLDIDGTLVAMLSSPTPAVREAIAKTRPTTASVRNFIVWVCASEKARNL